MKKSFYLTLAVIAVTLVACNSKPAASDQQAEESQTIEAVEPEVEEPAAVEVEEPLEADSLAAEVTDSLAEEQPAEEVAAEEPAAEEPAPAEEPVDEEETVFMIVESIAVPPCTNAEMAQLLTVDLNKVDPEASNCRVIVGVIVEKDGRVTHHEVKRSNCDNEKLEAYAIKLVQEKLPRFKEPARQSGHPVRSSYIIPVSFRKL